MNGTMMNHIPPQHCHIKEGLAICAYVGGVCVCVCFDNKISAVIWPEMTHWSLTFFCFFWEQEFSSEHSGMRQVIKSPQRSSQKCIRLHILYPQTMAAAIQASFTPSANLASPGAFANPTKCRCYAALKPGEPLVAHEVCDEISEIIEQNLFYMHIVFEGCTRAYLQPPSQFNLILT
jgi:hypothetical protein